MKYVNTGIVFQEIPDETTLAINISNCPCHCPGCHSSYLWNDVGDELDENVIDGFMDEYGNTISCISFMGGDADPEYVVHLARYIHSRYPDKKVGWYSGRVRLAHGIDRDVFDYLKIGPYIKHLGPLKEKTTNQRLYKKLGDGTFEDITYRFWNK